jgi:hypothetical protein
MRTYRTCRVTTNTGRLQLFGTDSKRKSKYLSSPTITAFGGQGVRRVTSSPDWELGTVFLFDPEAGREINSTFDLLYPRILAVFENEPFTIPPRDDVLLQENRSYAEPRSEVCLPLADPLRPTGSNDRPWWNIRFNLGIRAGDGYVLDTELSISIPYWLDSDWLLDFMIGARTWNNQPSLVADTHRLLLHFSRCRSHWLSFAEGSRDIDEFLVPFTQHLQIAKSVDRFSANPQNRFSKSNMLQAITAAYAENPQTH